MRQNILRCSQIERDLEVLLGRLVYDECFVLVDENTSQYCLPLVTSIPVVNYAKKIITLAGDEHKNFQAVMAIWKFLSENQATRQSLLVNVGGGMITDLGGFAAATFKRGIPFINIPTTLLGAVDAAVGGKTGINFSGLKNEVGSFALAQAVLVDAIFFRTLNSKELLAGYAEMLKHALLDSVETTEKLLHFEIKQSEMRALTPLVFDSIQIKKRIVELDPQEQGIRKALNFGHTFGHAFESLSYEISNPVPHGWAVAWGMICELYLSHKLLGFSKKEFMQIVLFIKEHYGRFAIEYKHYDWLIERMKHDKKNRSGRIHFAMLSSIGEIRINQTASIEEIKETLDFFRDFLY